MTYIAELTQIFSSDPRDFGPQVLRTPFFWKPHLQKYLDLPALQFWACEKRTAANQLGAHIKRLFALKIKTNRKYKKNPQGFISVLKINEINSKDTHGKEACVDPAFHKPHNSALAQIIETSSNNMSDPWVLPA